MLVEVAGLYEQREEYEKGIEALRRVVSEEPASEEAHAGLTRLYTLSGQRQEAILQYERLRKSPPKSSTRSLVPAAGASTERYGPGAFWRLLGDHPPVGPRRTPRTPHDTTCSPP